MACDVMLSAIAIARHARSSLRETVCVQQPTIFCRLIYLTIDKSGHVVPRQEIDKDCVPLAFRSGSTQFTEEKLPYDQKGSCTLWSASQVIGATVMVTYVT